ncbi:TlpA family protein disulfide reductase [Pseudobacter ginsenosidimutans]|uniref:Cytochrome oxidase Cu insertion factor (SCO1/SenC/PrrC family) n=1 Tax=Pseudobacter ginsenosidimutans TaxID=661488 RepID=A0A4Q7MZS1_9BACT|nr:TlpA disulfide reductase family protein [Pseudobacter ginsenosidimutans]QEC43407.1 TlpA family protein disulfide reductase [Pseudobacter ginsenosidimutans]RZS74780.1 cytochrome oxidase Cu insertion factor (SCO1/SenC/PrrC family) [Pseudobacter ginsenosidimutans]
MKKYILVLFFALPLSCAVIAQQHFQVSVAFNEKLGIDSLYLFSSDTYYGAPVMHVAGRSEDSVFHFSIPSNAPRGKFYISQRTPPEHRLFGTVYTYLSFIPEYPFEIGDAMKMVVTRKHPEMQITESFSFDYDLHISGNGAEKSIAWQAIAAAFLKPTPGILFIDSAGYFINPFQEKLKGALVTLEEQRAVLPAYYYELFKAQIICKLLPGAFFYRIQNFWNSEVKKLNDGARGRFIQSYLSYMDSLHGRLGPVPDTIAASLDSYVQFLYKEARFKTFLQSGEEDMEGVIQWIVDNYHGDLKEKLLIMALRLDSSLGDFSRFEAELNNISGEENKVELNRLYAKLEGRPAYNFQLTDTSGKLVQLGDLKGKVVFIDFWFTGCGACAGVYEKVLKEAEAELGNEQDIVFVSVCVDRARASWMKSVYKDEYTSPHVINLYTNGEGTQNNLIRYYGIQAFPQFLIIDREGKVFRFLRDFTAKELTNAASLVRVLKNLAAIK